MNRHVDPRDLTDTETRIINAAIEAILKFGPRKTTMNDIAEAAGLTRQTVYVSFGGKDNVLAEMVRFIGRQHLSQVVSYRNDGDTVPSAATLGIIALLKPDGRQRGEIAMNILSEEYWDVFSTLLV